MRNAKISMLVGLVATMTACGPAEWLNPCYNDSDVTFDPGLVGRWKDPASEGILRFRKADGKAYEVVYSEIQPDGSRQESTYEGHLVNLGGCLFLDMLPQPAGANPGAYTFSPASSEDATVLKLHLAEVGEGLYARLVTKPQPSDGSPGNSYELHLIQGHWVFRVWLEGDTLRLADLDEDWFKEAVNQRKVELGYEKVDDSLVLDASTPMLRAFLQEYGGDAGAFPEPEDEWSRQK